jgi:hypothetical protein
MLLRILIGVHVTAGLSAVVAGAAAMLAPKHPGPHPRRGRLYLAALTVLVTTAGGIVAFRPHTAYLLIPGAAALTTAAIGYTARSIRWRGWLPHHIAGMALSYIAMLTAFYVDNGPRLPVWKLLPSAAFWFLPTAAGLPLLIRTLRRVSPTGGLGAGRGRGPARRRWP